MKRKTLIRIMLAALGSAGVVFLLGIWLLYGAPGRLISGPSLEGRQRLETLLEEADNNLSLGYWDRVYSLLMNALGPDLNEYSLLRILKRAWRLAEGQQRYDGLEALAQASLKLIPGSSALQSIHLYARLRTDRPPTEEQVERLVQALPKDAPAPGAKMGKFPYYLWAEYQLRHQGQFRPAKLPPEIEALIALRGQNDPQRLQQIAQELGDERLLLDAALSWMRDGKPDRAFELIHRGLGDPSFDEAAAFISLDAGQLESALERLDRLRASDRIDLLQMLADIHQLLGQNRQAKAYYHRVITQDAGFSWKAYLNLARLLDREGDAEGAHLYRERARARFPEEKRVILALAQNLYRSGNNPRALQVLEPFLQGHPEDLEANLLFLQLSAGTGSPARYHAALWRLYHSYPASDGIARLLTRYSLATGDLEGAGQVLKIFDQQAGADKPAWFFQYRGILTALAGDLGRAARLMRDGLDREDSWQARYNQALILAALGRRNEAIEALVKAESLLKNSDPPDQQGHHSQIRTRMGEVYLQAGDWAAAKRELEYSIQLDRDNLRSILLLKKLEEPIKK